MKKLYIIILLMSVVAAQNAQAQVWMGVYGIRSNTTGVLPPDVGGGFAMNMLSTGKKAGGEKSTLPFHVQYGANFIWSGLGHRTFEAVPLLTQPGTARVTLNNSFMMLSIMSRLSLPNKSIFTPYADIFGGYRGTFSSLNINPYYKAYNTKSQTDQSLATVSGLNYGVGAGIMTALGKNIMLDLGVSYAEQFGGGQYADLNSAYADGSGVNLNMKSAPNGIVMFHFGLMFYIEDTGGSNCNCHSGRSYGRVGWGGGWSSGGGRSSSVGVHIGGGGSGGVRVR